MVVVVNYGMGNLRSVMHKLGKIGVQATLTSDPEEIKKADKIILPGVGAFGAGMQNLKTYNLGDILNQKVLADKTPVMGICLGMELFARKSDEGSAEGLGWIDAEVKRFDFKGEHPGLCIPHVGWNTMIFKKESILLKNIDPSQRFYFTHSYHLHCNDPADIVAVTHYGYDFVSAVEHENVYGIQFHPEKSHRLGLHLVKNFVEYA